MRVLVVDDDGTVRRSVGRALVIEGHDVEVLEGVAPAMERLRARRFDVVLTDLEMGPESGLDLLRAVRTERIATRCLLMTGRPGFDMPCDLVDVPVLRKPFDLAALARELKTSAGR